MSISIQHQIKSIYLSTSTSKKRNTKRLENILAKWPTQGFKNRLRVASKI